MQNYIQNEFLFRFQLHLVTFSILTLHVNPPCGDSLPKIKKTVKFNYFIVCPKVDQRAGLLSLPHLKIFAIHTC